MVFPIPGGPLTCKQPAMVKSHGITVNLTQSPTKAKVPTKAALASATQKKLVSPEAFETTNNNNNNKLQPPSQVSLRWCFQNFPVVMVIASSSAHANIHFPSHVAILWGVAWPQCCQLAGSTGREQKCPPNWRVFAPSDWKSHLSNPWQHPWQPLHVKKLCLAATSLRIRLPWVLQL